MILLRQDDLALWAVLGSILNVLLSFTLKQLINQERPDPEVCSGPGMPSAHAQSISFAVTFIILSSNPLLPLMHPNSFDYLVHDCNVLNFDLDSK